MARDPVNLKRRGDRELEFRNRPGLVGILAKKPRRNHAAAAPSSIVASQQAGDDGPQKQKHQPYHHDVQLADHGCPPCLRRINLSRRQEAVNGEGITRR